MKSRTTLLIILLLMVAVTTAVAAPKAPGADYHFTLLAPQTFGAEGAYSYLTRLADVNGDGRTDLVLASNRAGPASNENLTSIALAGQDGRFTLGPAQTNTADWRAYQLLLTGDINGDGRDDLVWYDYITDVNNVRVALGRTDGQISFTETQTLGTAGWKAYHSTRIGDVDGDGRADLIWNARNQDPDQPNHVFVGAGQENGAVLLGPLQVAGLRGWGRYNLTTADVNGDGRLDLLWPTVCPLHDFYQLDRACAISDDNQVALGLGNDDGSFAIFIPQDLGAQVGLASGWGNYRLVTGDLTGDGRDELVFSYRTTTGNNFLFVGQVADDGTIAMRPVIDLPNDDWQEYWNLTTADVDGDGTQELVWNSTCQEPNFGQRTCGGTENRLLVGSYDGAAHALSLSPVIPLGTLPAEDGLRKWGFYTRPTDVNGDGRDDLVWISDAAQRAVMVALSGSAGGNLYLPVMIR